jgi:hypothetical protein
VAIRRAANCQCTRCSDLLMASQVSRLLLRGRFVTSFAASPNTRGASPVAQQHRPVCAAQFSIRRFLLTSAGVLALAALASRKPGEMIDLQNSRSFDADCIGIGHSECHSVYDDTGAVKRRCSRIKGQTPGAQHLWRHHAELARRSGSAPARRGAPCAGAEQCTNMVYCRKISFAFRIIFRHMSAVSLLAL